MSDESKKNIVKEDILEYQDIVFVLAHLDDVNDVKVFQGGEGSSKRLIAVIVPENNTVTFSSLRRQMREVSPDTPIPDEFIMVDSIYGDKWKGRFENNYNVFSNHESSYIKSRNSTEEYLVKLWGEYLPVGKISVEDDFYALGGHSLLLAQMHFAIKRDMSVDMDFEVMLRTSMLSDLAKVITETKKGFY